MAARRLAISSLLCEDDPHELPPQSSPAQSSAAKAYDVLTPTTSSRQSLESAQFRDHVMYPPPGEQPTHEVHPRYEYQHHASDRNGGLTYSPRPPMFPDQAFEHAGYNGQHHHLQPDSSLLQTRGTESNHLPGSPPSPSYPPSRSPSSRGAFLDTILSTQSHFETRSNLPKLESPLLSPTSVYSLSQSHRRPSHSPVSLSRSIASPAHRFYSLDPSQRPYRSQPYDNPVQGPVRQSSPSDSSSPPMSLTPDPQQTLTPMYQMRPLSQSQHPPETTSTQSSAHGPSAVSPSHVLEASAPSSWSGGGLAGLEALAQVATQEFRRLSGGASVDSGHTGTSRSPNIDRAVSRNEASLQAPAAPSSPIMICSPSQPRQAHLHAAEQSYPTTAVVSPADVGLPRKRRRSSGESHHRASVAMPQQSASPIIRTLVPSPSLHTGASPSLLPHHDTHETRTEFVYHHSGVVTRSLEVTTIDVTPREPHTRDGGRFVDPTKSRTYLQNLEDAPRHTSIDDSSRPDVIGTGEEHGLSHTMAIQQEAQTHPFETHLGHSDHNRATTHESHDRFSANPRVSPTTSYKPPTASGSGDMIVSPFTLRPAFPDQFKREDAPDEGQVSDNNNTHADADGNGPDASRPSMPMVICQPDSESGHDQACIIPDDSANEAQARTGPAPDDSLPTEDQTDLDDELLSLIDDGPHTSQPAGHASPPQHLETHLHAIDALSDRTSIQASESSPLDFSEGDRRERDGSLSLPTDAAAATDSARSTGKSEVRDALSGQKKKTVASKPTVKKATSKPKTKFVTKTKTKLVKDATVAMSAVSRNLTPSGSSSMKGKKTGSYPNAAGSATVRSASTTAGPSRSRSASIMPGSTVPEPDDSRPSDEITSGPLKDAHQDDKLYCICKTGYDEDRVMIACDRCDEWYHTQCVNMPDLEVDLVDQFICPPCIDSNPHLRLKTTYRRRCHAGLKHPHPSSPSACHKPARGAFSKYCSDECGISHVQSRIDTWKGVKEALWESVKDARKREGVVVRVNVGPDTDIKAQESMLADILSDAVKSSLNKVEREIAKLKAQLDQIAQRRDETKKGVEFVMWREKLIELAAARADHLDECGWDQRLCFGEEEYAEYGAGVLESYDGVEHYLTRENDNEVLSPRETPSEDGEWWCRGKRKCDRHAGWQKLRLAEVEFEKETREVVLQRLTGQEREIRKQIEDVLQPKVGTSMNPTGPPLQPLNGPPTFAGPKAGANGGDATKKGKKKKS